VSFTTERARAAALMRHHPDNPNVADESRRALKVMKAERLITSLTTTAPVLALADRARLASLLLAEHGGTDAP
jgi:hypothetical protein